MRKTSQNTDESIFFSKWPDTQQHLCKTFLFPQTSPTLIMKGCTVPLSIWASLQIKQNKMVHLRPPWNGHFNVQSKCHWSYFMLTSPDLKQIIWWRPTSLKIWLNHWPFTPIWVIKCIQKQHFKPTIILSTPPSLHTHTMIPDLFLYCNWYLSSFCSSVSRTSSCWSTTGAEECQWREGSWHQKLPSPTIW